MTVNQETLLRTQAPPLPFPWVLANESRNRAPQELVELAGQAGEDRAVVISIENNSIRWPRVFPGL